jgi:hypothetical protein
MTPSRAIAAVALSALAALASAARAQSVFSPGELSRAHRALEGLASCTRCHVAGEQLSPDRCLSCHTELRARVLEGRGFHGRLPPRERACEACHHEHQGRDFALVDWGRAGKKGFDHARAGFELRGKHRRVDCARCHDRRLVRDPAVLEVLGKQPGRETLLGAPTACGACHFDEHRGQLGAECQRCHVEDAWKPAARFGHARAAYPLEGKHATVPCAKCHRSEPEPAPPSAAPGQTPPVSRAGFVRYKGLPFQACTDCHKDPHQGRLGSACAGCHAPADWRKVSGAVRERAFHDRTRYPLRGAHAAVRCEACHGPTAGAKARFRGLPFGRCTDCHADGHAGQLETLATALKAPAGTPQRTCDACHGLEGWLPARFEAADHDRLAYRLEGAHRAVACALCHPKDEKRTIPTGTRAELRRAGRPVKASVARFDVPRAGDCRTCHRDPHAGQFGARLEEGGCASCHRVESFRRARFDHAKDSRFPLTGKHEKAACGACHRRDAAGTVRYRPLDTSCAACHADAHAGQLAAEGKGTDCGRCHGTEGWKAPAPLRFEHRKPFTGFALEGKHRGVACEKCHPAARVGTVEVRRYRPLPVECEACHVDFHRGAFRQEGETRCARCHTAESWQKVAFSHDATGFPLEGRHREASCRGCHPDASFATPLPRACGACHADVHQGRLGRRCEKCHEATGWETTTFDADAHRRSAFPLTGRHAVTSCESCHGDRRDRGFTRPTRECVACHEPDWQRAASGAASVDHDLAGFPRDCRTCHGTWRFAPAGLPAHEECFSITRGDHAGIRCRDCHTSFPPVDYGQPFTCQSGTAACTRCHSCAEHEPVGGFACADRRCYECHRFSTDDGGGEDVGRARHGGLP